MSLARRTATRVVVGLAAAALTAGSVAGCGTGETGLKRDTARQLQARVLEVTQASSQNDPNGALKALEGLEAELAEAQDRGDISEERHRSITTIATAVRADLEDAIAAAEQAAKEKAAAEQAATQSPVPEVPAPAATQPADSGQDQGNGAPGKGEDKGKGKD
ncbi:hypothetical protein [Arthrobacter sp. AD-310]